MKNITVKLVLILLFPFALSASFAQGHDGSQRVIPLKELQMSIQKALNDTKTAGAGIVMLSGDSAVWIAGVGKADRERNIDATANTMFRLGSISKMIVSLAILKLQEEGKLTLKDRIADIIPEIKFDNPWEAHNPVRIEHLLEHTSGWSFWHMAELGSDDPKPKTLREALDYYPKSRKCLYVPGTRNNESNVGTAVAAYVVEKVSGMSFEDYVDRYLFKPMGIEHISFYNTKHYQKVGASLYENGVKLSYFNILYRPAAAINASPKDFAKVVALFVNGGVVNGTRILSDSSIRRMERSESMGTLSRTRLFKWMGLSNMGTYYNGFLYHGFGGSLPGGNAAIAYLPEYKLGFAVMVNDGNEDITDIIAEQVANFQVSRLPKAPEQGADIKHHIDVDPSGYYTPIEGKIGIIKFFERIKGISKVWTSNDTLFVKSMLCGNSTVKYLYAGNNEYKKVGSNDYNLLFANDPLEGQILINGCFLKKISPLWTFSLIILMNCFLVLMFTSVAMGVIGMLVYLIGKKKNRVALKVCLWPLAASLSLFIAYFIIVANSATRYEWFQLLGTANIYSIMLLACGICYVLASGWSVYYIFKARHEKMAKLLYYHSVLAAAVNLLVSIYLLLNEVVGVPTWM